MAMTLLAIVSGAWLPQRLSTTVLPNARRPRTGSTGEGAQVAAVYETFNSSGWEALKSWLLHTKAFVVCAQEHHLLVHRIAGARAWCAANGWLAIFGPAIVTDRNGTSGGTAVIVRDTLSLLEAKEFGDPDHIGRLLA